MMTMRTDDAARLELFKEGIDLGGNRLPAAFTVNFHGYHLILLYHILKPEYSVISRRKAAGGDK